MSSGRFEAESPPRGISDVLELERTRPLGDVRMVFGVSQKMEDSVGRWRWYIVRLPETLDYRFLAKTMTCPSVLRHDSDITCMYALIRRYLQRGQSSICLSFAGRCRHGRTRRDRVQSRTSNLGEAARGAVAKAEMTSLFTPT
ncbi:hypothetical protein MRB53_041003 [Persea americana]|nr:hypothetical protein MRB53_041003 [Persea americana]